MKLIDAIVNFFSKVFAKKSDKLESGSSGSAPSPVLGSDIVPNPVGSGIAPSNEVAPVENKQEDKIIAPDPVSVPVANPDHVSSVKIPTRDEMMQVYIGMIEGTIPTKIGAYKLIRESHGKNRSPHIDEMITRQGGKLAEPYCQYGMQESLDELCAYYKVDRKKVNIPEGGGTQTIWSKVPQKYKRATYEAMCWVTWQNGNELKGHVGMALQKSKGNTFHTFEFNTTAKADGVVRDGQGAEYAVRDGNGYGSMHIKGFTDVYQAIVDAMDPAAKMGPLA